MAEGPEPDYRHITFGTGGRIDSKSERIGQDIREIEAHLARNREKLKEASRKLEEFKERQEARNRRSRR